MRTIGVVTVARSDYGIYLPLLRKIQADPELRLHLIVAGTHLSPEFGLTVREIEADGFEIGERVDMLLSSDTPEGIAKSMGLGTLGFAQTYARFHPDILLVLGDRFEVHAAVLAALPFKIPVGHIHGGELTQGAFDDALRHSITKLSHLHFVATQEYLERVIQLGEEPWRVMVTGALSLDNLHSLSLLKADELEAKYGLCLERPVILATFHPVSLEYERVGWQVGELLAALDATQIEAGPVVFTLPNADTNGRIVMRMLEQFVRVHPSARMVKNLGVHGYFSLMAQAVAMVGNSSSGIIEAPSFRLPVVNVGTRQHGRIRAANVIDVGYTREEIITGIRKALTPLFREELGSITNPYNFGQVRCIDPDRIGATKVGASERIIERLKSVKLDDRLVTKRFYDVDIQSQIGTGVEE